MFALPLREYISPRGEHLLSHLGLQCFNCLIKYQAANSVFFSFSAAGGLPNTANDTPVPLSFPASVTK